MPRNATTGADAINEVLAQALILPVEQLRADPNASVHDALGDVCATELAMPDLRKGVLWCLFIAQLLSW